MAAYTSTTSGRFSAGSTWVGGVAPSADGDTWTIATGHTVDYDYDNSALTNGWGNCTVTGTLRALGELAISNDGNGTISSMSGITGLTPLYMTGNKVYPSVVDDGGGNWHIDIYKESGRTTKIAHTGNIAGDGTAALTADGGSGVGGSITIANFATIAADVDIIASGYFYCKMNGAISGAGTVSAGSDVTAYPGHLWIRFEQTKPSGDLFTATNMTLRLYCDSPVIASTTLSGVEAIGQTALSVAANLTTDAAHWINGAMVRIDDLGAAESEERTIDSISATELTVTAGLTAAKQVGALVTLVSRNISILGPGNTSGTAGIGINFGTGVVVRASVRRFNLGIANGTSHTIGGTVSNCNVGVALGINHTISAAVTGCAYGVSIYGNQTSSRGHTISGVISGCTYGGMACNAATLTGTITACTYGFLQCSGVSVSGTISNCTTGIYESNVTLMRGCTLSGNTQDVTMPATVFGYGARLQSATPVTGHTTQVGLQSASVTALYDYADSGGTPQVGWFKSWMQSGVIATGAATAGGPTNSHLHTFANATDQLRLDIPIHLQANVPYEWTIQVKSAQAPNGMTLRPTFSICDPQYLPYHASESLASVAVPNDTSTAWQTVTLTFTPPQTREYVLRGSAKNASGSFEWWYTRASAVFPATGNTSTAETAYGPTGAEYAGTMPTTAATTASVNAADAAALESKKAKLLATETVTFGASSVTGTLPQSKVMQANGGNILTTDVRSDTATGLAAGGTVDLTNMVGGNIVTGVSIGGVAGSYPTTATSKAAQKSTDQAALVTNASHIRSIASGGPATILAGEANPGTLDIAQDNVGGMGSMGIGV